MRIVILIALASAGVAAAGTHFILRAQSTPAPTRDNAGGVPPSSADRNEISDADSGPYYALVMGDAGLTEVPYYVVGEDAVTGGDILLGTHADVQAYTREQMDRLSRGLDRRLVPGRRMPLRPWPRQASPAGTVHLFGWGGGSTWPRRTIVYRIGSSIPSNDIRRTRITQAIADWNATTPLRFKIYAEASQEERNRGVLLFVDSPKHDSFFSCYSYVGFKGWSEQTLKLNPSCSRGNIRHEIGHAIGLHHEHQRTDRRALMTVHSIPNSANYGRLSGQYLSSHDLCSMMHYSPYTTNPRWFSLTQAGRNAWSACKPQLSADCDFIGQRCRFSTSDVASINRLYANVPQ